MSRPKHFTPLAAIALLVAGIGPSRAAEVLLSIEEPTTTGLVVAPVELGAAARLAGVTVRPEKIRAADAAGKPVPIQFVPGPDFDPAGTAKGTVLARLPDGWRGPLRVTFDAAPKTPSAAGWDGVVATPFYKITHSATAGGMPNRIVFQATGKQLDGLRWNDRLHHRELKSFNLENDRKATRALVSDGPLATVVRVRAAYQPPKGKRPAAEPQAVYDWCYFHDRPLVLVTAVLSQREAFAWHEVHFLELTYSAQMFSRFAGGDPLVEGPITDSRKVDHLSRWGAVVDGQNAIGMFQCGSVLVYHGPPAAKYLQAGGDSTWRGWDDTRRELSGWLWIGAEQEPIRAIQTAAAGSSARPRVVATTSAVRAQIAAARQGAWIHAAAAQRLESQGRLEEAVQAAGGKLPTGWTTLAAGELGAIFDTTGGGLRLVSLYDSTKGHDLLAASGVPLFEIVLHNRQNKDPLTLTADLGWQHVERAATSNAQQAEFCLQQPASKELTGLKVTVRATADAARHRLRWQIDVGGQPAPWTLWSVAFPRVALDEGGPQARVLYPQAAGVIKPTAAGQARSYQGTYPSGWTALQTLALYDPGRGTGLYTAIHDPAASTKQIIMQSRPADRAVVLAYEHPVPGMGQADNRFQLYGEGVWQLLRGDWFDAAVIYRDWVRREARWYPQLARDGRSDTPLWMRELSAWVQTGGAIEHLVPMVEEFAAKLKLPVGLHWYNWHQIPFDNDYPHYFPVKKGFPEGVKRLQQAGVYVMPYINGRLWDTRDHGLEDRQFTSFALPAATKDDQGKPLTEKYSSKEADGSPVVLAAMCPTQKRWQEKLLEIDLTLFNQYGVKGIYMDQIAAAKANLCCDPTHGHPLGGGHWWTEQGYWPLLAAIRAVMPKDRMLTTECNAEPYIRWFDGYLTWHWQYDGQVPAFAAVYGGSIQMFGRAYRSGPTRDLALRMKAGQQLVFGEQIGWMGPEVVRQPDNFEFLRKAIHLRWNLRRYFYAGEMARPPHLLGNLPTVTADWQWQKVWPVTTDQVLCGAWRLPAEGRLVLVFVNVDDTPVTAQLDYNLAAYGFCGPQVRATRITADGPGEATDLPVRLDRFVTFPARSVWAWEVKGQ
jgi:hypothetical protein